MNASVTLRNGRHATIRVLQPSDRTQLAAAFERLSPRSRYRRFLGAVRPRLTDAQLRYFTELDHHGHEALAAFDDEAQLIGVARFARKDPDDPCAEVAITVVDDWQGCGLGSALMELLAQRAQALGIERFGASCFADNALMLDLLDRAGPANHHTPHANVVDVDVDLENRPTSSLLEGIQIGNR